MSHLQVLCCLVFAVSVRAVTIDEHEVIMREPPPQHAVDIDDLFGYSAALHNLADPATSESDFTSITRSARILVGVPNGTTEGSRVQQTGYVLECPLTPGPCTPLRGSGEGNDTLLYDETSNADDEDKSEQFLGVAMESRNGAFAVCGHRWKNRGSDLGSRRDAQGKCLVSRRSLREFQLVKPCTPGANAQLLSGDGGNARFIGYCLSGTDVTFLDDGSLAIGAPGYQSWNGAGFLYSGSGMAPVTMTTGQSLVSYGGMSVGQARITNPTKPDWIMSAPRANRLLGQVNIFTRDASATQSSDRGGDPLREMRFTLTGNQIGAYFGYSVGGVDFNGDGFDDVLVGAPLYFKGSSLPEVGAVYIYENTVNNNIGSVSDIRRITLTAPGGGVAYSRFGHAIAPLGDLDDDGFNDVAISAPFGQGLSGTVYIYRGSRQGIITTPAQTLVGSELNLMPDAIEGLTSFGAFLSGTTDIDGNQYNDLIIGAFMSRKVFVMRSRNVATIVGMVRPISTSVTIGSQRHCPLDQSANHCFQVQFCLSIKGKGFREGQLIAVNYTLYADNRTSGLQPRATFRSGSSILLGQIALTVNSNDSWCYDPILYIQTTNSEQLRTPLRPVMTALVPQGDLPSRSDGNQEPTDLTENRIYIRTLGTFSAQVAGNKECLRTLCTVDVYVRGNPVQYIIRSHEDPTVTHKSLLVGVVSDILINTTVGNTGPEAAYNVKLVLTHPPSLTLSHVEGGAQFICETDQITTRTFCSTPNGLKSGAQLTVPVRFVVDSSRIDASVNSITVSVEVQVEDDDSDSGNNVHTYHIPVRFSVSPAVFIDLSEDELLIATNVTRSGLPKSVDQIGRRVNVNVAIANDGPSAIGQGRLTIHLPYRTPCTKNSFLLYLHKIHQQNMQCTVSPPNALDTLRLAPSAGSEQPSTQGSNRDAHLEDIPGNCSNADSTVHIICDATVPGCVTVVCRVSAHQKGTVHSVLVTAYLDDVFYKNAQTSFKLFFRAVYEEVLSNDSTATGTRSATDIASLLVRKSNLDLDQPVEAWVIAVPLVAVIAVIVGFIGFLWMCGFFKRKQSWKTKDSYDFDNERDNDCHTDGDKYSANGGVSHDCIHRGDTDSTNEGGNGCGDEVNRDCDNESDNGGENDRDDEDDKDSDREGDKECDNEGDKVSVNEGDKDLGDDGDNESDNDCNDEDDKDCDREDDKEYGSEVDNEGDKDSINEGDKELGDEGDKDTINEGDKELGDEGDNDCGDEGGNDCGDESDRDCGDEGANDGDVEDTSEGANDGDGEDTSEGANDM